MERVAAAVLVLGGIAAAYVGMTQLGDARPVVPALAAILVVAAAAGLGSLVLRAIGIFSALDRERWVWSGAIGLGVIGHAMLLLAHAHAFDVWSAGVVVTFGLIALALQWRDVAIDLPRALRFSPWSLGIVPVMALVVLRCTAPPTFYDTLVYHLGLPMQFAARGGAFVSDNFMFTAMPLLDELAASPALLLGGPEAFGVVHAAIYILAVLACAVIAYRAFGVRAGGPAALVFATMPVVVFCASASKPDVLVALFAFGALRAIGHVATQEPPLSDADHVRAPWAHFLALCLGFGAATKTFFLPMAATTALVILVVPWLRKGFAPSSNKTILVAAVLAIAVAAPPYLRNLVALGDPVWPFLTQATPEVQHAKQLLANDAVKLRSFADLLSLPYDVSFVTPPVMNDVLGGLPLLGIVLVFLERKKPRALIAFLLVLAASVPVWLLTSRLVRYDASLFTVAPLACGFVFARALERPYGRALAFAVAAPIVFVNLTWSLAADELFLKRTAPYLLRMQERDELLSTALEPYRAYARVNATLSRDACVLLATEEPRIAYLEVPAIVSERYAEPVAHELVREGGALADRVRSTGATHILVSQHLFRALAKWSWPLAPEDEARFNAYVTSLGAPVFEEGAYRLYAIPEPIAHGFCNTNTTGK